MLRKVLIATLLSWTASGALLALAQSAIEGKATSISSTAVTVSWSTGIPTTGEVILTKDESCSANINPTLCASATVVSNISSKNHAVVANGLIPSSIYYYQIISYNADGVQSKGSVQSFKTRSSSESPILPDLKIDSLSLKPESPTIGKLARASFKITNPSRIAAVDDFNMIVNIGSKLGANDISSNSNEEILFRNLHHDCAVDLLPLGSCTVKFDLIYKTAGIKNLHLNLDPENVISEDNSSNNALAHKFEVREAPVDDRIAPSVSLSIASSEATRAFVKFSANEESLVEYEYGLINHYGNTRVPSNIFSSAGEAYIEELSPLTIYYIRAKATDRAGNVAYSPEYVFTTSLSSPIPKIISGPYFNNQKVSWTSFAPCDGKVQYGPTTDYGNSDSDKNAVDHEILLTNLVPSTTYQYKVTCSSTEGTVESSNSAFTTAYTLATAPKSILASILESLFKALSRFLSFLR